MWKKIFAILLTLAFLAVPYTGNAKSLWVDRSHSIFADKKARNVGDILTIVINESTTQTATKSRSNSKDASIGLDVGVGVFGFLGRASSALRRFFRALSARQAATSWPCTVVHAFLSIRWTKVLFSSFSKSSMTWHIFSCPSSVSLKYVIRSRSSSF